MSDDRKYRPRGYMDSDSERPRTPRGAPEEGAPSASPGAPRGRSAGLDKELALSCKKCGQKIRGLEEIRAEDVCPKCGNDLHSCQQCKHFDTASRWECAKSAEIPARVANKTRRNECPLYSPTFAFDMTGAKAASTDDARDAFEKLFKK